MQGHPGEEPNFSRGLYQLIKHNFEPGFSVLQIGTYEGVTAVLFALTCARVVTIDPYEDGYNFSQESKDSLIKAEKIARKRLAPYPNVTMIKQTSKQVYEWFGGMLDAVYIDGDHTKAGVEYDLSNWKNKVRPGGYICGHDIGTPAIEEVVNDVLGGFDKRYEDGSWAKRV